MNALDIVGGALAVLAARASSVKGTSCRSVWLAKVAGIVRFSGPTRREALAFPIILAYRREAHGNHKSSCFVKVSAGARPLERATPIHRALRKALP